MELIYTTYPFNDLKINDSLILTIGEFDGLHLGHLEIFNKVMKLKEKLNCPSAIISFDSHPDLLLNKVKQVSYLTPQKRKEELLEKLGFDYFIIIKFDDTLSKVDHEIFASQLSSALSISHIVAGPDFRYGYRGLGNVNTLVADFKTEVTVCKEYLYNNHKLGTVFLKDLMSKGQIYEVNSLSFVNYTIEGIVVEGNKIGRTYNYPTANIKLSDNYCIPRLGVYEVYAIYDGQKYHGICNIGHNPTFNYQQDVSIEVHLFNFSGNLYNQKLTLEFIKFIRPETKFSSKDSFIEQLKKDIESINE